MKNLLTMDELDSEPTNEELSKARTEMASWKQLEVMAYWRTCVVNASPVYYISHITF